jgi:hypothetical protein
MVIIIGLIKMTVNKNTFNDDFYNKIKKENIIKASSNEENISISQLFVSSITKGEHVSDDQRSFSGWGFFMAEEKPDGNIFEFSQYGNLFNADPIEASIKGVIQAIKRLQNTHNLEIIFENSYVPIMFSNEAILNVEKEHISTLDKNYPEYWRINRRIALIEELKKEFSKSENIIGLSMRYSPDNEHIKLISNDKPFSDNDGFNISQENAEKGFTKAVKGAVWFLINNKDSQNLGKSIVTCRKNLNNSYDATRDMMVLISEMKEGILPDNIRKKIVILDFEKLILDLKGIKSHSKKVDYIDKNKDKIELVLLRQNTSTGTNPPGKVTELSAT